MPQVMIIIQRIYQAPTGAPADGASYIQNQALGDGTIAAVITSGATTTTTVTGLIQGTRYHYTLFPYGYNGTDLGTYNYKTDPVVPAANDSTLGAPPSRMSVLTGVNGSESNRISSLTNGVVSTTAQGQQVWQLKVMDGGLTMNDPDDLPTIVTRIIIGTGPYNQTPWNTAIQSAALFDDSTNTLLANATYCCCYPYFQQPEHYCPG